MRDPLPSKLFVERWPEECDRQDCVHYEQTGYGVDEWGRTSEITVYAREDSGLPGLALIVAERQRQVRDLTWSAEHDDHHDSGQLAMAAACYAAPERIFVQQSYAAGLAFQDPFPWPTADARPHDGNVLKDATDAEALRLLVKAGALIAAEIDRLLRAGQRSAGREPDERR